MTDEIESKVASGNYKESTLNQLWLTAKAFHRRKDNIFRVISAVDKGEQWSIYKKKIRPSQSLPTSNILSTIRDTRLGALNITGFVGEFMSETDLMDPISVSLTDYMTHWWRKGNYDTEVSAALESMLTLGTGITMVTSDTNGPVSSSGDYIVVDDITLTNIDPEALYPDPGAKTAAEASYFFHKDTATIEYLRTIPMFKDAVDANIDRMRSAVATTDSGTARSNSDFKNNYETKEGDFITYIGKVIMPDGTERWDMIWLFGDCILYKQEGIEPGICPLIFLKEERDKNSFWGQSTYKKNLALQLSVNELDSAVITHAKKQQDPPVIIDVTSGINLADYAKHRDKAGRIIPISGGNAASAVQYLEMPDLARDISGMSSALIERIKEMSGVGDIASGRSSGSLQTSGGISQIIDRAGLKDVKVITNIQRYLRSLYETILEHVKLKRGIVRYAVKDHAEQDMAYKQLDLDIVDWTAITMVVDVVNHTGSAKEQNRQIISELYQQSVQYASAQPITEPMLMTTDEYLEGLKNPNLHRMINQIQERRKRERELDMVEKVTQIIQIFSQLEAQGHAPQEALIITAQEFAGDPGLLKGFTIAEMQQQQAAQQSDAGGQSGSNQHQNTK